MGLKPCLNKCSEEWALPDAFPRREQFIVQGIPRPLLPPVLEAFKQGLGLLWQFRASAWTRFALSHFVLKQRKRCRTVCNRNFGQSLLASAFSATAQKAWFWSMYATSCLSVMGQAVRRGAGVQGIHVALSGWKKGDLTTKTDSLTSKGSGPVRRARRMQSAASFASVSSFAKCFNM